MVGRWVGDDDGDAGFGASVSFKEFFVVVKVVFIDTKM
jgi:hypothetical protein